MDERLHYMKMTGNEVFKHAVRCMCDAGQTVLDSCGPDDRRRGLGHSAPGQHADHQGHRQPARDSAWTSSASTWTGSATCRRPRCPWPWTRPCGTAGFKKGDIVLFMVFGGGFTWGAIVDGVVEGFGGSELTPAKGKDDQAMSNAVLFSGQGAQSVGMGKDLAERYPGMPRSFDQADEVLGYSLSTICFEGPDEELTQSNHCQPAIFVTSVACYQALRLSGAPAAVRRARPA